MYTQLDLQLFIALTIPALVANGSATLISRGHPIDWGKKFLDGRRILGDGKTFEGFLLALTYAFAITLFESQLLNKEDVLLLGFVSGLGAMIGDCVGSFIKRRIGLERGEKAPILDQLDFLAGAYAFLWLLGAAFPIEWYLGAAIIVYMLHRLTNIVAYKLKIKDKPW